MKRIDVKAFSEDWKAALKEKVSNIPLHLVIIQVGDNPASNAYIRGKLKDSEELGVQASLRKYPEDVTEKELLDDIEILNMIPYYSGIIVQLPLPENLNEEKILNKISPFKDVDGLAPSSPILPCTPYGVIYLLEHITTLKGKTISVIGRSKLVGAPLARELEKRNATVLHCNSHTPQNSLESLCRNSDIVISCAGVRNLISDKCVDLNREQIFVDVGINRNDEGKLCGDLNPTIYTIAENSSYTPVPGGVGLLTRCAIFENLLKLKKLTHK